MIIKVLIVWTYENYIIKTQHYKKRNRKIRKTKNIIYKKQKGIIKGVKMKLEHSNSAKSPSLGVL